MKKKGNLLVRTNPPLSMFKGGFTHFETDFATTFDLVGPQESDNLDQKKIYPYQLAVLNDADGDLKKRWSVYFWVYDTSKGKLARKQIWISTKILTKSARYQKANEYIKEINKLLASGYHLGEVAPKTRVKEVELWTLMDAFEWAYNHRQPNLRTRSVQTLALVKRELFEWLKQNNLQFVPLKGINYQHCEQFMDYLKVKRKLSNVTFNNYQSFLKRTFNYLIKHQKLDINPADKLSGLKVEESERVSFTPQIKKSLLEHYERDFPPLKIFAQFIYYTFIRPAELRKLRVRNVMETTIFIPGNISKNKKSEHVLITPAMERLLGKLDVRKYPPHFYLIGKQGIPDEKIVPVNYFTKNHLAIRKKIKLMENYTLYCWKHTGVVDTYLSTLDLEFVSRHCRHSSLDMTKNYLRGLGLMTEYHQKNNLPDLEM